MTDFSALGNILNQKGLINKSAGNQQRSKCKPRKIEYTLIEKIISFSYVFSCEDVSYACALKSYVFFFFFRLALWFVFNCFLIGLCTV